MDIEDLDISLEGEEQATGAPGVDDIVDNNQQDDDKDKDKKTQTSNADDNDSNSDSNDDVVDDKNKQEKNDDSDANSDDDSSDESSDEKDKTTEEDDPLVVSILESSGYEFEEDELEGIDESEEGLKKTIDLIAKKKATDQYTEELGQYDDVKEYLEFRKNGGDPQDYFKAQEQISVADLELSEDDVVTQRQIVRENLKGLGYDDEAISEEIAELEESDRLYNRAERNLGVLKNQAKKQKEQLLESQQERQKEQRQKFEKYRTDAQKAIENNQVPINVDKDIVDYFFGDGQKSQYQEDAQKLDIPTMLTIAQIVKNGGDINGIVDKKADKKSVQKLRDRLKQRKKGGNDVNDEAEQSMEEQIDNIKFS